MAFSDDEIAQLLYDHGLRSVDLITGIEIVLVESGGNPDAKHYNNDQWHSLDRGFWQFNNHWHSEVSDQCAYDPDCSTAKAVTYKPGFQPWDGDKGSRSQYASRAEIAAANVTGNPGGPNPCPICGKLPPAALKAMNDLKLGNMTDQEWVTQAVQLCIQAGGDSLTCTDCAQCIITFLRGAGYLQTGCSTPSGINEVNPIAWLGYFGCVLSEFIHWAINPLTWKILGLSVAGGLLILLALVIIVWDAWKR